MARIAGVDLPRNKRIEIALTYIHGIGHTNAAKICSKAEVAPDTKTDRLSDGELVRLARGDRARLHRRGRPAPRDEPEHQDADGHRLLSRPATPPRPARARSAHHTNARTRKGPVKTVAGKKQTLTKK
jgi:small subunit ribosomal protein S13